MQKLKIKMALVFQTTLLLCFQRQNMDYHVLYTALSPFCTRFRANLFAQCETKTKIQQRGCMTSENFAAKIRKRSNFLRRIFASRQQILLVENGLTFQAGTTATFSWVVEHFLITNSVLIFSLKLYYFQILARLLINCVPWIQEVIIQEQKAMTRQIRNIFERIEIPLSSAQSAIFDI